MERLLVYLVAFLVPLLFALITPFCKATVKNQKLKTEDWFIGLDFQLAGLATGIINLFDRIKQMVVGELTEPHKVVSILVTTGAFICASFILLFVSMYCEQQYVSNQSPKVRSVKMFGFGSMVLGALYIYAFAVLKVRGAL